MREKTLTPSERAALASILASGGLHERHVHMGRLDKGDVRTLTMHRLINRGLVECVGMGTKSDLGMYPDYYYFITAAGIMSLST